MFCLRKTKHKFIQGKMRENKNSLPNYFQEREREIRSRDFAEKKKKTVCLENLNQKKCRAALKFIPPPLKKKKLSVPQL